MRGRYFFIAGLAAAPAVLAAPTTLPTVQVVDQRPALAAPPPALSTEVDAERVEAINASSVDDALRYQPNLVVRKRFIGDRNATLSFRDMHTTQTARALVLGDGLLLSNFLGSGYGYAPRWSVMQPEEIERVEVIYGPYAAEYGGNTLGGAVILHGRMPDALEANVSAGAFGQDFQAYGTDESLAGYKLHGTLGNRHGPLAYFLAVNRLENQGHPQTYGIATPAGGAPSGNAVSGVYAYPAGGVLYNSTGVTDVTEDFAKFKLGYELSGDLEARFTLAYLKRDEDNLRPETFLRDASGNPVYNGAVDIDGQRYNVSSQRLSLAESRDLIYGGELEGQIGSGWEIKGALSFYDVLDQTARASGTNYAQAQASGPGTVTVDENTGWQAADLKLGHRHQGGVLGERILFGYHYDRYRLDQASFNTADWRAASRTSLAGDSEGSTRVHALFLENEWRLAEAWRLTLGGRQEWWRAYEGALASDFAGTRIRAEYPERSESRFSPKASLSFRPDRDWHAQLSLGIAHRFPTVGELYQGGIDNTGAFNAAFDPNLKTERAFAKNLMIERDFKTTRVTVNLWENDVRDTLYRQTNVLTNVTNVQNIDRVRSRGIELVTVFDELGSPDFGLEFNLAYTRAEILENAAVPDSVGKQFPRVPSWRANAFAHYRATPALKLSGGLRYASDPYDTLDNSDGGLSGFGYTDAFLVADVRAAYQLSRALSLAAGIDNLTDERYFVYHPYPARTFHAELKWTY